MSRNTSLTGIFEAESRSVELDLLATEIRIKVAGRKGRIKVLAADPRTARGFSDDLILGEFASHQDDVAICHAAEPVLSTRATIYAPQSASDGLELRETFKIQGEQNNGPTNA